MVNLEKQIHEDILMLKALETSDAWKSFCDAKKVQIDVIKERLDREPSSVQQMSNCNYHRKSAVVFEELAKELDVALGKMPGKELVVKQIEGVARMCRRSSYTDIGGEVEGNCTEADIDKKRLIALCDLIGDDTINPVQVSLPKHLIEKLEETLNQAEQEAEVSEVVNME